MKTIILAFVIFFPVGNIANNHHVNQSKNNPKEFISESANCNSQNKDGDTPLHLAVKNNNFSRVESLLKGGANPNQKNNSGFTPLHISAYLGFRDISILLIRAGASLNIEATNGNTPAQLAIKQGHNELVKEFYREGWDIHYRNQYQTTALHTAVEYGQLDLVGFLIEKGADINMRNKYSRTPLHCAFYGDHDTIARFLINKGAELNMIGMNASDIYATAKAYEMYANSCFHNGDIKSAIIHWRIATDYLEKASIQFNLISQDFKKEATNKKWLNLLEFMGAAASAYGSAISSPIGYGSGYYRVRETATFEEIAEIYKRKAEDCHISAIKSYLILHCIDSVSSAEEQNACFEKVNSININFLLSSIIEESFSSYLQLNFQEYVKSEPFRNYVEDIIERHERKDIAKFIIPTYQAMISGIYNDLEDSNVALAKRLSPEMFVQAFINVKKFMVLYEIIMRTRQMDTDEFFVCFINDCLLSNKRIYVVDKDQLSTIVNLEDIQSIQQDIKLTKVKTIFELKSGDNLIIEKNVFFKPVYLDRFRELLNK
jgi:hypothetical protein